MITLTESDIEKRSASEWLLERRTLIKIDSSMKAIHCYIKWR